MSSVDFKNTFLRLSGFLQFLLLYIWVICLLLSSLDSKNTFCYISVVVLVCLFVLFDQFAFCYLQ